VGISVTETRQQGTGAGEDVLLDEMRRKSDLLGQTNRMSGTRQMGSPHVQMIRLSFRSGFNPDPAQSRAQCFNLLILVQGL
jgi:hypothetical protein